jgi:hypothetical protein
VREVWKFAIPKIGEFSELVMPKGAEVVHFGTQVDGMKLWALVNVREKESEARAFIVVGTGWDAPDHLRYHKTLQDGSYVWHLFERGSGDNGPRDAAE